MEKSQIAACVALAVAAITIQIASAQTPKSAEFKVIDGLFTFERIEEVELSKKEIIGHAAAFIAEKFKSSKSIVELRDDELGKIVGDVVLRNPDAGMFDAFKAISVRLVIDAKDGKYRLQATNIVGIDGNGKVSPWGQIESANQYRMEPLASQVLPPFAAEFKVYMGKAKHSKNW